MNLLKDIIDFLIGLMKENKMAKIKTHVEDCERLLGKGYKHIHIWLDEYTKKYPVYTYLEYHRQFRHTEKAIEKLGFYEKIAAKIHIIRDYELYCLNKAMDLVELEEIDRIFEKCKQYLHKGE